MVEIVSTIVNPLDTLIALNHGIEINDQNNSAEGGHKFYAKCKAFEDLKKKKYAEWMMKEHLRYASDDEDLIRKSLRQRKLMALKKNYQDKLMRKYFGNEEECETDETHSQEPWV